MSGEPSISTGRRGKGWLRWSLYLVFLLGYVWAYTYFGAVLILEKNTERTGNLQGDYIEAVYRTASLGEGEAKSKDSIYHAFTYALPQYTNGFVDPLWPWLMSRMAEEPPDLLFERGKWANLILSLSLLVGLGIVSARAFSFLGSAALILMGGFGVILERSAYFSPDALFYLIMVLVWLCALSLIRKNSLWLYGVFGLLLGLAFLAKPLVWPVVAGFVVVSLLRSVAVSRAARRQLPAEGLWVNSNQMVGFAMVIAAFVLVAGPRMSYANERFGDPFHSYIKYVVWLDDRMEAIRFQRDHPDREALAALTWRERPGLVSFVEANGVGELLLRGWKGAGAQVQTSIVGRGGWVLVYSFVVFLTVAGIHRWAVIRQSEEVWQVRGASARWMLLFLVLVCGLTLFHAGIGNEIVPHNSMTISLFLPILVTFVWMSERYRRQLQRSRYAMLVNRVYAGLMLLPCVWIAWKVVQGVRSPVL